MKFGYGRVSTQDQKLDAQLDALKAAGCERIFMEKISSRKAKRPQLEKLFEQLRPGDTIVIMKLDRLGRGLKDLINLVERIKEMKVNLVSLSQNIDTSTPVGKLIFHVFAMMAEFERDMISERTKKGLAAARARGKHGGRPKGLSDTNQAKALRALKMYNEKKLTTREIKKILNIGSQATLYRWIKEAKKIVEETG